MSSGEMAGNAGIVAGVVISTAIISYFDHTMALMLIGIWLVSAMAATMAYTKT